MKKTTIIMKTDEYYIKTSQGNIFAKKWTPENPASDIPVILLHDSLGCVELWRDFPKLLAKKLSKPVIAYDRAGFGKSYPRFELPGLNFIEEEATKYFPVVKKELLIKEYALFGHSVGGGMSINIAAGDNDCKAVVTAASQAFVEDLTVKGITEAKKSFQKPGQIDRLKRWHGNKAKWVLDAWTDIWLSPQFSDWSLKNIIGNVLCPVLAIHGQHDEYGSNAFPEFIYENTGGTGKKLILKNCGHLPHREKPLEVSDAVKKFLKGSDKIYG